MDRASLDVVSVDRTSLDVVSWPVHKLGGELPSVHECVRVLAWEVDAGGVLRVVPGARVCAGAVWPPAAEGLALRLSGLPLSC